VLSHPTNTDAAASRTFQIHRCLGVGGFGEVYLASMTSSSGVESDVALKVLHQGLDPRSQAIQRLRDEGRLLGMLQHPSILQIHDLVFLQGRVALVTEYVPGQDLDKCLRGPSSIGLRAAVEVIGIVADALDTAWNAPNREGNDSLRLVHRDIKPSNIRLGRHGDVKLLDFGIAKAADSEREAKTRTNMVIGSFMYMPPERFEDGGEAPTSDVYSLGCTLYECISGERVFEGVSTKQQYLYALNKQEHERFRGGLDAKLNEVPEELGNLIREMMRYDPAKRPTMAEVCTRCEGLSDDLPGLRLRQWAKARDWTDTTQSTGPLDGRVISEDTMFNTNTTDASTSFSFMVDDLEAESSKEEAPQRRRWVLFVALTAMALTAAVLVSLLRPTQLGIPTHTPPEDAALAELAASQSPSNPNPTEAQTAPADPAGVLQSDSEVSGSDKTPTPQPQPTATPSPRPVPQVPEALSAPSPTTAAAETGHILVTGHADKVWLIDRNGVQHSPGDLEIGTYEIVAKFPNVQGEHPSGPVEVTSGAQITLACRSGYFKCTVN